MQLTGADADKLQPVFVTLDPARDTAAVLREYATAFDAAGVVAFSARASTLGESAASSH